MNEQILKCNSKSTWAYEYVVKRIINVGENNIGK